MDKSNVRFQFGKPAEVSVERTENPKGAEDSLQYGRVSAFNSSMAKSMCVRACACSLFLCMQATNEDTHYTTAQQIGVLQYF